MSKQYRVHRTVLVKSKEEAEKLRELTYDLHGCIMTPKENERWGRGYDGMYSVMFTCYKAEFEQLITGLGLKKTRKYRNSGIYIFENELA